MTAYFRFNTLGELLIYISAILGILFFLMIAFQVFGLALAYRGRQLSIKVEISEYIQPEDFTHRYVSLRILNNECEDLTDCFAAVEIAERFYNKNDKTDMLNNINPNHLHLTWGGGLKGDVIPPGNDWMRILKIGRAEGAKGRFVFIFDDGYESIENFANANFRLRNYDQSDIWVEFIDYEIALNENLLDVNSI